MKTIIALTIFLLGLITLTIGTIVQRFTPIDFAVYGSILLILSVSIESICE